MVSEPTTRRGRSAPAQPAKRKRKPGSVGLGRRALVAVGIPAAVIAGTVVLLNLTHATVPTPVLGAVFSGAVFGGLVLAVAMPWRRAPVLALAVGLAVGVLTYSPDARTGTGTGVEKAGTGGQRVVEIVKGWTK